MFILGYDDGHNVGPFDSLASALRYDLKQIAENATTEDFAERARLLLLAPDLRAGLPRMSEDEIAVAKVLVSEVDHLIFEIILHVNSSHSAFGDKTFDDYENLIVEGIELINPEKGL